MVRKNQPVYVLYTFFCRVEFFTFIDLLPIFLYLFLFNKEIVTKNRRSSDARDKDFFRLVFINIKKLALESILEIGAMGPTSNPFCYV